jgi:hypothetical protein
MYLLRTKALQTMVNLRFLTQKLGQLEHLVR